MNICETDDLDRGKPKERGINPVRNSIQTFFRPWKYAIGIGFAYAVVASIYDRTLPKKSSGQESSQPAYTGQVYSVSNEFETISNTNLEGRVE